ncbi:hypothetical protein BJ508DRAFT_63672 [Ascobolus immersus RN42]|uniref:Uncharacterized protein n=1 Tax=Ascobolus immersus RN42 TaxID=1160509 RepID=A0A3N4IPL3_ASCIM|nr:hypothetical protein BJ508DRAFT_63672 [Ascobolus immersus RN42]
MAKLLVRFAGEVLAWAGDKNGNKEARSSGLKEGLRNHSISTAASLQTKTLNMHLTNLLLGITALGVSTASAFVDDPFDRNAYGGKYWLEKPVSNTTDLSSEIILRDGHNLTRLTDDDFLSAKQMGGYNFLPGCAIDCQSNFINNHYTIKGYNGLYANDNEGYITTLRTIEF